jgi:hypothetical protein
MPILRVLPTAAFRPSEVEALAQAFETICRGLKFGQTDQSLREIVARKVIECAEAGERDPDRICDHVLNEMQGTVSKPRSVRHSPRPATRQLPSAQVGSSEHQDRKRHQSEVSGHAKV